MFSLLKRKVAKKVEKEEDWRQKFWENHVINE